MSSPGRGLLVVISGPSGVGKGTVVRRLLELDRRALPSVSVTTRRPRAGEVDGVDYHFVDDATFDAMVEAGDLLEWAEVHQRRYGTPRRWAEEALAAGNDVLLEIDVQGAEQVRERVPDALLVFLAPPTEEELVRRLVDRGTESAAELAVRADDRARELGAAERFDEVIVNDDLVACVAEIAGLVATRRGSAA